MTRPLASMIRIVAVVYATLLAAASLLPSGEGPLEGWDAALTPDVQDALHVPAYAVLFVLAAVAWSTRFSLTARALASIAAACVAFGLAMELAQAVIPGRTCGLSDALANTGGTVLGLASVLLWRRLVSERSVSRNGQFTSSNAVRLGQ